MTAADDKFCNIFSNFQKNKECQQTILMKYHDLFVIFEKAAKIEIVFQQLSIYMAVANINIRIILIGEQTNLYTAIKMFSIILWEIFIAVWYCCAVNLNILLLHFLFVWNKV